VALPERKTLGCKQPIAGLPLRRRKANVFQSQGKAIVELGQDQVPLKRKVL
jgi:hypothetical protein